ncbi:MAG: hypothetical protein JWO13_2941 [Acidobacteriales bacterium]|nr:hypothetical protein [Terriglobales bacterium]
MRCASLQYRIPKAFILALLVTASLYSSAADLTGTVTNKTTNKPAVGDDVILLRLAQGMDEVARTKTDAQGHFKLNVADAGTAHLVRVNHRNVNYHRPAPPGTTSVDVDVFDAAESLDNISQSVDVMRLEADGGELRVVEMYGINNASNPPRTLMSPKSFEMVLPDGAKIMQALAAGPGGMPVTSTPIPTGEKNHYTFLFPIRPGETRFQVAYSMPYSGSAKLDPKLLRPTENFAVSIPKSMQITPAAGSKLEAKGEDAGMSVYVAQKTAAGAPVGFTVSGTGTVALDKGSDGAEQGGTNPSDAANRTGPGGGLGTPINTPDGLSKYKWWLIALVALMLVGGAAYSMNSLQNVASAAGSNTMAPSMQHTLKEELFELESERLQNKISPEEYAKAKAALDLLMLRVASRKG